MSGANKKKPNAGEVVPKTPSERALVEIGGPILEEHYRRAVVYLAHGGKPSTSALMRKFRLSYNSATTLLEFLERRGAIQPYNYEEYNYFQDSADDVLSDWDVKVRNYEFLNNLENLFSKEFIESKTNSDIRKLVEDAASASLGQHFLQSGISAVDKQRLIDDLASAVLQGLGRSKKVAAPQIVGDESPGNEKSVSNLPSEAPVKWKDREPDETAPDFVRRAYGPWLKDGISKRVLRNLDPTLITELNKWVREGNEMPDDIKILTISDENRQMLDAGSEAIREHLGKFTGAEAVREARRLTMAKHRSK